MRYVSIDIETTGLNPAVSQVIEFAAVVDDLEHLVPLEHLATFRVLVDRPTYVVEKFCTKMHKDIWEEIQGSKDLVTEEKIMPRFHDWLCSTGFERKDTKITAAGKNFAMFDYPFIKKLPYSHLVQIRHRVIDPSMFFLRHVDKEVPNLEACLERSNRQKKVKHRALDDALDVVDLIRFHFRNAF